MDYNQNSFDVQDNNLLKKARVVEAVKDGEIKAVREFIAQGKIQFIDFIFINSVKKCAECSKVPLTFV